LALGSVTKSSQQGVDLFFLTISELSKLIRTRKVSPVEVTRTMLQRIEELNPTLNAYITVTPDLAIKSARQAEAEIQRGQWRGPLHGVPIAVKDLIDTAGVPTTAASAIFKDRVPEEDAEVIRKLKSAGAVLLGKLNMHEFAYGGTSTVSHFGPVRNPWASNHVAGGSSGGAAAVAAGLCFGALGSDTGGSIREPAAYCAIVGLKATYGMVSTRGVIPLAWSLDHIGPMTRCVADATLMLQAIAGYDELEITSRQFDAQTYTAPGRGKVPPLRLGIPRDFFFESLDPEIEAATKRALAVLGRIGASIKQVSTVPVQNITDRTIISAEAYAYHAEFVAKKSDSYQQPTLALLRTGADVSTRQYILAQRELAHFRRVIRRAFEDVDAIVTPTTPIPPPTISAIDLEYEKSTATNETSLRRLILRNTSPFNKYGLPTISVPCGFTQNGLPMGLQISGPPGGEAVVLRLAAAYEEATEWHKKHPIVSD
jgi:aspartyl-tRNA(Asn)/glutamyl-tRNA(Gln) amidotransferase subunit A